MKKIKMFLTVLVIAFACAGSGHTLVNYIEYTQNPMMRTENSAPWYTGSILVMGMTLILVAVTAVLYIIVCRKIKKTEEKNEGTDTK